MAELPNIDGTLATRQSQPVSGVARVDAAKATKAVAKGKTKAVKPIEIATRIKTDEPLQSQSGGTLVDGVKAYELGLRHKARETMVNERSNTYADLAALARELDSQFLAGIDNELALMGLSLDQIIVEVDE